MSRLRTPLGALEACFIKIIADGLMRGGNILKGKPVLFVIDEFGIHCDPVLMQKMLDIVFQTTLSMDNLYTVIITHNPDILTRTLKLIEKRYAKRKNILDKISLHQFLWDKDSRSIHIDTFGVKSVEGIITQDKRIAVFEEAFEYMDK